jgi:hypothetical protein
MMEIANWGLVWEFRSGCGGRFRGMGNSIGLTKNPSDKASPQDGGRKQAGRLAGRLAGRWAGGLNGGQALELHLELKLDGFGSAA